jgi:hypothetical protein
VGIQVRPLWRSGGDLQGREKLWLLISQCRHPRDQDLSPTLRLEILFWGQMERLHELKVYSRKALDKRIGLLSEMGHRSNVISSTYGMFGHPNGVRTVVLR